VLALALRHPDIVTQRDIDLIPIAALYHDTGHGPFSHLFDQVTHTKHEDRSKRIVARVVDRYHIPLDADDVDFIQTIIDPPATLTGWRFNIVSNDDIDTDRMDYLIRDSQSTGTTITTGTKDVLRFIDMVSIGEGGCITYPPSVQYVINDMKYSRQYMHARVYQHHTVVKIGRVISMALVEELIEAASDLDLFLSISDAILQTTYYATRSAKKRKMLEAVFQRRI
jgi:HD superfamily phosphohydrolase